jgi:hypothetical protein
MVFRVGRWEELSSLISFWKGFPPFVLGFAESDNVFFLYTTLSGTSRWRPMMATCAPWWVSSAAISWQMPEPPSVTSSTFPFSMSGQNSDSITQSLPSSRGRNADAGGQWMEDCFMVQVAVAGGGKAPYVAVREGGDLL